MNKKPILALVALWSIIGLATATVVDYLSNTTTVNVNVDHPLSIQLSNDSSTWSDSISAQKYGGETLPLYVKITNRANVETSGVMDNKISNPSGINCSDITNLIWDVTNATVTCSTLDANTIKYIYGPTSWGANSESTKQLKVTFAPGATGTYTFVNKVLY